MERIKPHLELATRIFIWAMLSVYGSGKIIGGQFYRFGKLPEEVAQIPLANVGGFDLAWTFFGYSTGYIWFIGLSQLIGAFLLLFEKTKLLGVAILIPILLNIIVVDYFFEISNGAMLSAILYFLGLCLIAYWSKEKVIATIQAMLQSSPPIPKTFTKKIMHIGIAAILAVGALFLQTALIKLVGR